MRFYAEQQLGLAYLEVLAPYRRRFFEAFHSARLLFDSEQAFFQPKEDPKTTSTRMRPRSVPKREREISFKSLSIEETLTYNW